MPKFNGKKAWDAEEDIGVGKIYVVNGRFVSTACATCLETERYFQCDRYGEPDCPNYKEKNADAEIPKKADCD